MNIFTKCAVAIGKKLGNRYVLAVGHDGSAYVRKISYTAAGKGYIDHFNTEKISFLDNSDQKEGEFKPHGSGLSYYRRWYNI
jgi:hypothetical protein